MKKKRSSYLIKQLREFIGNKKAVIGISGGVDSAVVAALCCKAVGKKNVICITMPYSYQDTDDAALLMKKLGRKLRTVNIYSIVEGILDCSRIPANKLTKGNIMARSRMVVLYACANEYNGLVIGTSNKSEIQIGYFTKYGDGGVDVEPIGDLYKTEVYKLAKELKIPKKIINKKPSAELWPGQTDENELGMTYKELDAILKSINMMPNVKQNYDRTMERYDVGKVKKVMVLMKSSKHKRCMPPILKV